MVTDDDRVKILDFGLAKLLDPFDGEADARTRSAPLTEAGWLSGPSRTCRRNRPRGARSTPLCGSSSTMNHEART